ncbi:signaling mucin MSB2-like [Penaeus chinensis]|uniref:signaling mucin MSB2-like n=1 Tax=Penaeus chinensis TaxID=139456 RepID=UPI001FB60BB9|nr:signaling mucin MSB2-like [Penaeus chinensis]
MGVLNLKDTAMVMVLIHATIPWVYGLTPQDCLVYDSESDAPEPKILHRQITMGVSGTGSLWNAKLSLTSQLTEGSCDLLFVSDTVAASCTDGNGTSTSSTVVKWPPGLFVPGSFTELWLRLGDPSSSPSSSSSSTSSSSSSSLSPSSSPSVPPEGSHSEELYLLGRRGNGRGFLLVPSTRLKPPLSLTWGSQSIKYYYNCVTGCLKETQVTTPQGLHTVFLLKDQNFQNLSFSYSPKTLRPKLSFTPVSLSISLTQQDLKEVPEGSWGNITVVWNTLEDTLGALVNGKPAGSLDSYNTLNKMAVIEGEVEGGGFLTLCDPRFQLLQDALASEGGVVEVPDDVTSDVSPSTASSLTSDPDSFGVSSVAQTNQALMVVCILLSIVLLILIAVSYSRTSAKLRKLGVNSNGEVKGPSIVRRSSSTYSKVRCSVKSLKKASDDAKDSSVDQDECRSLSDATVAMTDVTSTPLATPNASSPFAAPRGSKVVSTSEFIDIDIGT